MSHVVSIVLSGIGEGVPYFLAAAGLSLIFGVMGILNFALGATTMLGAFFLTTVLGSGQPSIWTFIGGVLLSGALGMLVGIASEAIGFRRTFGMGRNALAGLLLSFGLLLLITGAAPAIWGSSARVQQPPKLLAGATRIWGTALPYYVIFSVVIGAVVAGGLYVLLRRSRFGRVIVAVSHDRVMSSALGISPSKVSMWMFGLAGGLAGLAGAMIAPTGSIDTDLASSYQVFAFVAVVIGGLGSVPGAFIGAMIIGIFDSVLVNYAPTISPFSLYIAAGVIIMLRPHGLFGEAEVARAS